MEKRRIGILTGGGDCPGLNGVIQAVVRACSQVDIEVFGFTKGWDGPLQDKGEILKLDDVSGWHRLGGTNLYSSRTNIFNKDKFPGAPERVIENLKSRGIESIIAIGGDDTIGVARQFKAMGVNMIGVPKTIDNDIPETDRCFGYDTAVSNATEFIDRIRDTARSHGRISVVELMGRNAGWITLGAGMASGCDIIAIPEFPISIHEIVKIVETRKRRGKHHTMIAVSEGVVFLEMMVADSEGAGKDSFGHVKLSKRKVGEFLAEAIKKRTGYDTISDTPGYSLRGGSPTASDRILAKRLGIKAATLAISGNYGFMVSLKGEEIIPVELEKVVGTRCVDLMRYNEAKRACSTWPGMMD